MKKALTVLIAVGLVVTALGAVSAASASAAGPVWKVCEKIGGKWETKKCSFGNAGTQFEWVYFTKESETETIESNQMTAFDLEVPALAITIRCEREHNTGTIIGGEPGTDEASVRFTECFIVGAEPPVCVVHSTGAESGEITSEVNTKLANIGGVIYDKFTPKTEPFTTIEIEGAECSVVETGAYEVKGTTAGEVGPVGEEPTLTFSEAISTATETQLTFGGNNAFLSGTSKQKLTGPNAGAWWGAVANVGE